MGILSRIPAQILVLMQWIVDIVICITQKKEIKEVIPTSNEKLLHISAIEIANKIRKREISSVELISIYIKRIEEVNPIINAVVENRFADALVEAKKVDEYLRESTLSDHALANAKPLLGVPITIKESLAVKGLSFTGCSLTRKGIKADRDAESVKLLKDAGAIILLVSSTPEYCMAFETSNNLIGRTRNPYDTTRVAGGSSGGEGTLLGAGASLIGIGTDLGGSIRVPCAFNGIYGHKPTAGIVSLDGDFPFPDDEEYAKVLVVGPMTRYVEDLKITLKILSGNNAKKLNLDNEVDFENINLFYMYDSHNDLDTFKLDKKIIDAVNKAVKYLSNNYQCRIIETKFPEMSNALEMLSAGMSTLRHIPNVFTDSQIKYNVRREFLKFLFGKSIFTFFPFLTHFFYSGQAAKDFTIQRKNCTEFKKKFENTLGQNGVFLYPSFPTEAFKHNGSISAMSGGRFVSIANVLGCPVTSVPIGMSKNGLPLGIQVMAAPYQDNLCLEVAEKLDEYFGGWEPPY